MRKALFPGSLLIAVALMAPACATTSGTGTTTSTPEATGTTGTVTGPESVAAGARRGEIPVGQELDVRLQSQLSSGTAKVEDRFQATTAVDLMQGSNVLIPAGSTLQGVISSVDPASRTDRKGSMTLSFEEITIRGRDYPIRAMVTQALESEGLEGELPRIGAGAGVGAIIGGIIGGLKGALAGVLIGAGGTILATEGKDVVLPAGTIIRIRFDSPLVVQGAGT
jgi:hypothetical protein